MPKRLLRHGILVLALYAAVTVAAAGAQAETWLRVDTDAATLSVIRGERVLARFENISIGRGGASRERLSGDQRTPLGEFHIVKFKQRSSFHRFFIIDYPNTARARLALRRGRIDTATFEAIRRAVNAGELPPQNTPLGSNLGIHGLGAGDPDIHAAYNWTEGCIALTNDQIDELAKWIHRGTRVVID